MQRRRQRGMCGGVPTTARSSIASSAGEVRGASHRSRRKCATTLVFVVVVVVAEVVVRFEAAAVAQDIAVVPQDVVQPSLI